MEVKTVKEAKTVQAVKVKGSRIVMMVKEKTKVMNQVIIPQMMILPNLISHNQLIQTYQETKVKVRNHLLMSRIPEVTIAEEEGMKIRSTPGTEMTTQVTSMEVKVEMVRKVVKVKTQTVHPPLPMKQAPTVQNHAQTVTHKVLMKRAINHGDQVQKTKKMRVLVRVMVQTKIMINQLPVRMMEVKGVQKL